MEQGFESRPQYTPHGAPLPQPGSLPGFGRAALLAAAFSAVANLLMYGLLKGQGLGINLPVTVLAFYTARALSMPRFDVRHAHNWVLLPFIFLFSLAFMLYNNGFLLFLNGVALVVASAVQLTLAGGGPQSGREVVAEAVHNLFAKPFCAIGTLFKGIFRRREDGTKRLLPGIILGVVLALAITLPVVALLSSADAVFGGFIKRVFALGSVGELLGRLAVFVVVFVLSGSAFVAGLSARKKREPKLKKQAKMSLVAAYIVLCALAVPLVVFALIQALYLTRAAELPFGMTYSEYARSGFFQLLAAAALVFAVTALLMALTRHAQAGARTGLRVLYTLLAAGTLVMLVSAFWRLSLYEASYGYTRLRLYSQAFTLLLGVVLLFFILRVWQERLPMARVVLVCLCAGLCALTLFNVDGYIGQKNSRPGAAISQEGTACGYDLDHLLSLGIDALPGYAGTLDIADFTEVGGSSKGSEAHNFAVQRRRRKLREMWQKAGQAGPLDFNLSRFKARAALEELLEKGYFEA